MLDLNNPQDLKSIVYTVTELLKAERLEVLFQLVNDASITIEQTGYDNWNGGMYLYTVFLSIDIKEFVNLRDDNKLLRLPF